MAKKDSKNVNGKGFVTKQERGRKRINTTVGVIVAAMAVVGIIGMALKGPDSSAQAASGSNTAASAQEQAAAVQNTAALQDTASTAVSTGAEETVTVQSQEKTATEETAVTAAGGSETASTADTASDAGVATLSGTYTLPSDMNVYASADESGQVLAQLYAGNQVQVGESAGNGWYSVTVWVGSNGSYAETAGYMKLQ